MVKRAHVNHRVPTTPCNKEKISGLINIDASVILFRSIFIVLWLYGTIRKINKISILWTRLYALTKPSQVFTFCVEHLVCASKMMEIDNCLERKCAHVSHCHPTTLNKEKISGLINIYASVILFRSIFIVLWFYGTIGKIDKICILWTGLFALCETVPSVHILRPIPGERTINRETLYLGQSTAGMVATFRLEPANLLFSHISL